MPLFDLQCEDCGTIDRDVLLDKYKERIRSWYCEECCIQTDHETLAPLCAMQPDNMWAGTDTRFGHFTSKSEYNRLLKERSIETVDKKELDNVRKKAYNAKQDRVNKVSKKRNEFLAQELANVEISPDDAHIVRRKKSYVHKQQ